MAPACYHLLRKKPQALVSFGEVCDSLIRSYLSPVDMLPLVVEIPSWQACRSRFFLLFLSQTQNIMCSCWTRYPQHLMSL